jgi:hypothetical protein
VLIVFASFDEEGCELAVDEVSVVDLAPPEYWRFEAAGMGMYDVLTASSSLVASPCKHDA